MPVRRSPISRIQILAALLLLGPILLSMTWDASRPALADDPAQPAAQDSALRSDAALGSGFQYQGRIADADGPLDAICDFQFRLFDAESGGSQLGDPHTRSSVEVRSGQFSTLVNHESQFGAGAFGMEARWLEVALRCPAGEGSFEVMLPRQALSAVPLAQFAASTDWSGLRGLPADFADGQDDDTVGQLSCADGEVPKWAAGRWDCAADLEGSGAAGVGNIRAGEGLSGGGTGPDVDLRLDTGFTDGRYVMPAALGAAGGPALHWNNLSAVPAGFADGSDADALAALGCADGQVVKRSGGSWACAADEVGSGGGAGTITGVTAGTGLNGGGSSGNVSLGLDLSYADGRWARRSSLSSPGGLPLHWANLTGMPAGFADGSDDVDDLVSWAEVFGQVGTTTDSLARGNHNHLGQSWSGTVAGPGLKVANSTTGHPGIRGEGFYGVYGDSATGFGVGVYGHASNPSAIGYGIYGDTEHNSGFAGYFKGKVQVAGQLIKSSGSFKIDHPLDPENQYLYHSFVESPDMKNIYDGIVGLDQKGEAEVQMPDWFDALNREFRYQLTPIGAPMRDLYVAREMRDGRFRIAGGLPGKRVSWQVTGIRQDPYAEQYRIPIEEAKPDYERGSYIHPEVYGQPASRSVEAAHRAAAASASSARENPVEASSSSAGGGLQR